MITIFNRKELIVTMDMKRQAEVRNILSANKIDYTVKTTDMQNHSGMGSRRGHTGSLGMRVEQLLEYQIYVHKKDYEQAAHLIGN